MIPEAKAPSKVSVVVCTYTTKRINYVLSCIGSLRKQILVPGEVILTLDPDKTLVEFYESRVPKGVKIVVSEGHGLSYARNAALKHAKGEIIAFIDDDAAAEANWLSNLIKDYDDSDVMGVGGLIKPVWKGHRPLWFPEELDWVVGCSYKGLAENRTYVRNIIGCNMSFRKCVFQRVGLFRTDIGRFGKKLIGSEETELSMRVLKKIPWSLIVYDPSAIVYHTIDESRTNLRYFARRSFYEGFSKALLVDQKSSSTSTLSVETDYLKYLIKRAFSSRLLRLYELESICQLIALVLAVFLVLIGYFVGRAQLSANRI